MTISRKPHPVFSFIWLGRYLGMFAAIMFGSIVWLGIFAVLFLPVEGYAVAKDTGQRDTLSEVWTWVIRHLSKVDRPFTGWNWLAAIFATLEAGTVWTLATHHGLLPDPVIAVMCIGVASMLHAHWLNPDVVG